MKALCEVHYNAILLKVRPLQALWHKKDLKKKNVNSKFFWNDLFLVFFGEEAIYTFTVAGLEF